MKSKGANRRGSPFSLAQADLEYECVFANRTSRSFLQCVSRATRTQVVGMSESKKSTRWMLDGRRDGTITRRRLVSGFIIIHFRVDLR